MEHRKPFKLKTFMVFYNIYQIIACVYVIKLIWTDNAIAPSEYFNRCTKANSFVANPKLYNFTLGIYWLKASEMLETFVFVLRKKNNQISFLHVFHHCATITMTYLGGYSGYGVYFFCEFSNVSNLLESSSLFPSSSTSLSGHCHQLVHSCYHV